MGELALARSIVNSPLIEERIEHMDTDVLSDSFNFLSELESKMLEVLEV